MPPFWAANGDHQNRRRLRRSYSLLLTSTSFLVLLLVTALVLSLVVVPTLRSFTSHIFRPNTVKHSWDSLNLLLVLFAVVCGFLTKNDTNQTQTPRSDHYHHHPTTFSDPATPPHWYEYSNRSFNRLRSFGSYPDLRQHSSIVTDDERCLFYDDTHLLHRHRYSRIQAEEELGVENVRPTATFGEVSASPVRKPSPPPPSPPPPPPPPPPVASFRTEAVWRNVGRTSQSEMIAKPENIDLVAEISQLPSPPPAVRKMRRGTATKENAATVASAGFTASMVRQPEPEPQPPPVTRTKAVRRNTKRTYQAETIEKPESNDFVAGNSEPPLPLSAVRKKKRGTATKEFLTSFRVNRKKQRQRSVENFESILVNSEPFPLVLQPPPSTPPPPPPPPSSVFHNLFSSKKSKHKTHYLVPVATYKPQSSNKREHSHNYSLEDKNKNVMVTGNESPLIPIPPPPPPPPFKLPAWKFRVQGDFVRIDSIGSSRSDSPDLDEAVESPISQQEETSQCNSPFGEEPASASAASLFCPSPDVDTKAHNFIESFRAGLRIAKMNSMKEKQGIGRSNLGPLPNPSYQKRN